MIVPDWVSEDGAVILYNQDCLDVLPTLEAGSVDAILTDLPYGTTACTWDTVIPFAPMWAAVKCVLKPRGVFVTTASQPFTSALVMSNPAWFRYEWIWEKALATGHLNANRAPMKAHEDVCVFSKSGHTYNPQKNKGRAYHAISGAIGAGTYIRDKKAGEHQTVSDGYRFPRSVLWFNGEVDTVHRTQKPVALYEYLVRTYTNEGDTVLDFCTGSGTTGVACIQLGRRFIGIEREEEYFRLAKNKIEDYIVNTIE